MGKLQPKSQIWPSKLVNLAHWTLNYTDDKEAIYYVCYIWDLNVISMKG